MNGFSQLENGILASQEALDNLAKKKNSTFLVLSDSHGSPDMLMSIIEKFGAKADGIIFAGDGIYDLISVLEKAHHYHSFGKNIPPVVVFVKGNNDPATASATFEKHLVIPSKVVLTAGCRQILITHGNNEGVYYDYSSLEATAQVYGANAVLFGHTHVPLEFLGTTYLMNPGSVGYPRHQSPASFAILEILGPNINSIFYKIAPGEKPYPAFKPYIPEPFYGF